MPKRFKWAVIGLLWAFAYGFLSVLATGGGHGNFVWFAAFLLGYFFGLFIPVMGFVGADFEPMWAKAAGATLIVLWLFFIFLLVDNQGEGFREDIVRSWQRSQLFFILLSTLHLTPMAIFITRLVSSLISADRTADR